VFILLYLYCAVEGSVGTWPATAMPDGQPPRLLRLDDAVSLVVSDVPDSLYDARALEPRLSDLDWVSFAGAAHHAVIDALADQGLTVVPFRLFSLFSGESAVLTALSAKRAELGRAFDRIRGRQEWVLRIGAPDPTRLERLETAAEAPISGTGFLQAKADAKRAVAARSARVREDAGAARDALQQFADATRVRPVENAGTLMIDAAFLVRPDQVDAMRETLTQRAERLLRDGCPVSLTGPWPPYSFAAMEADG
jgi:hypothetical protein